jgi:maltooligosyltrehalose trehalohydrolase
LNFDGSDAEHVRRYFIDNALYWLNEFQIDGLRLDAIHGIHDFSARHILEELSTTVHADARASGRNVLLIAESDLNDPRVITAKELGGRGLDAQWSDDFHHALHTRLTGARQGYFADFGSLAALEKALTDGFVYDGCHSGFRGKPHGAPSVHLPGEKFVVYTQNHDQIANGSGGKRHARLLSVVGQKLTAFMLLVVAPNVPMLFMGQEYGDTAPFQYFTSHGDADLAQAVSDGRKAEFAGFGWEHEHEDPQAVSTFEHSKLDWSKLERPPHAELLRFYQDLLRLRASHACLRNGRKDLLTVERSDEEGYCVVQRDDPSGSSVLALLNFTNQGNWLPILSAVGPDWRLALHTDDVRYGGSGSDAPPARIDCDDGAPPRLFCPPYAAILYLSNEKR